MGRTNRNQASAPSTAPIEPPADLDEDAQTAALPEEGWVRTPATSPTSSPAGSPARSRPQRNLRPPRPSLSARAQVAVPLPDAANPAGEPEAPPVAREEQIRRRLEAIGSPYAQRDALIAARAELIEHHREIEKGMRQEMGAVDEAIRAAQHEGGRKLDEKLALERELAAIST